MSANTKRATLVITLWHDGECDQPVWVVSEDEVDEGGAVTSRDYLHWRSPRHYRNAYYAMEAKAREEGERRGLPVRKIRTDSTVVSL